MSYLHIIHENDAWTAPLRAALDAAGVPFKDWFIDRGILDFSAVPPPGVYYNRMSASAHTRDHRFAPEHAAGVLAWLERHGRTVFNTGRALSLEVSKVAQYTALAAAGIRTPRTVMAIGRAEIAAAASRLPPPYILKPNRGGKGAGVALLDDLDALVAHVESEAFVPSVDGVELVQEYIRAPRPEIVRAEFVGGRFLYAVRVDTADGFELCPADQCVPRDAACPVSAESEKFRILERFDHPLLERYTRFLAANGIHMAGIEFVTDERGEAYTYDVNTNTNYNPRAEAIAGKSGMRAIAQLFARELGVLDHRTRLAG